MFCTKSIKNIEYVFLYTISYFLLIFLMLLLYVIWKTFPIKTQPRIMLLNFYK